MLWCIVTVWLIVMETILSGKMFLYITKLHISIKEIHVYYDFIFNRHIQHHILQYCIIHVLYKLIIRNIFALIPYYFYLSRSANTSSVSMIAVSWVSYVVLTAPVGEMITIFLLKRFQIWFSIKNTFK